MLSIISCAFKHIWWAYLLWRNGSLTFELSFFCMVEESQGLLFSIQLSHRVGFPDSSVRTESTCNVGEPSSIPGSGRSAGEGIGYPLQYSWASLVAQLIKNLPAMWETWVPSMGWEDPLEKRKATMSIFWPGEFHELHIPWGCKELDKTEQLSLTQSSHRVCGKSLFSEWISLVP